MDPESTALGALAKVGAKLVGGVDLAKLANARMDRHARLLDDRTTKEINADAASSDFELTTIDVRTKLKLAIGDRAARAIADSNPILLRSLARSWEYAEREQWNVESTLTFAAAALTEDEPGTEPSDEWLHHFQDGAKFMSDDDLRSLWGSVLAQEMRRPGSVSKRTLGVMKTMDKKTALAFQRLRSLSIGYGHQTSYGPMYAVPTTNDENDKDDRFAEDFHTRELLDADDLCLSSITGHKVTLPEWDQVVEYQGDAWCLKPTEVDKVKSVKFSCSAMGLTGNEIARVVNVTPDDGHKKRLIDFLASKDVKLVPLPSDCEFGRRIPTKYRQYVFNY